MDLSCNLLIPSAQFNMRKAPHSPRAGAADTLVAVPPALSQGYGISLGGAGCCHSSHPYFCVAKAEFQARAAERSGPSFFHPNRRQGLSPRVIRPRKLEPWSPWPQLVHRGEVPCRKRLTEKTRSYCPTEHHAPKTEVPLQQKQAVVCALTSIAVSQIFFPRRRESPKNREF